MKNSQENSIDRVRWEKKEEENLEKYGKRLWWKISETNKLIGKKKPKIEEMEESRKTTKMKRQEIGLNLKKYKSK